MSVAQAEQRRPSPLLSNNPFRNRIGSGPSSPLPLSETTTRVVSTNPFLDNSEVGELESTTAPAIVLPAETNMSENTRELFENLGVNDRGQSPRRGPPPQTDGVRRPENMPPRPHGRMPLPNHRPSASEEDRRRRTPRAPPGDLDIFADPPSSDVSRLRERRPRRNSESSVRDKASKPETEEDKKRRERRAREKRGGKPKDNRRLDIIDKLDVTSIYGMGLFHHDGPFDACNPHRNRKGARQAPMQAFPKDSRNMALGGSGPNNSRLNLDQIHGVTQEAHNDYNEAAVAEGDVDPVRRGLPPRTTSFNPLDRSDPVHGEESVGLGTSTFLEGAPASRAAIQRRESENEAAQMNGGALSRKKSLAQKIRAVRPGGGGRMNQTSPEPMQTPTSPMGTAKSESNVNPFFKDYDQEYEKKGAAIAFAEQQQKPNRARAPSSPKRGLGLERKMTQESIGGGDEGKSSGGLLSRVKSLKGRRARAERREAS